MTRKQIKAEMVALKKTEKMIYDYRLYHQEEDERLGLLRAIYLLYRKRKRLEAKLKWRYLHN